MPVKYTNAGERLPFAEYWTDGFGRGHNVKGFSSVHYYKNGLKLHTEKQIYGRYCMVDDRFLCTVILHDRYYTGKRAKKRLKDFEGRMKTKW